MISTFKNLILASMFFSILSPSLRAQDYPYEDKPADALKNDSLKQELPKETPPSEAPSQGSNRKKGKTVQRFTIKAGGNGTLLQDGLSATTTTVKGIGFEGLLALGWDLAYQPLYLEVESGYRGILMNTNSKLHLIPLRMAAFYRNRLSDTSFFKIGAFGGLGLRIIPDFTTSYATVPLFGISTMLDFDNFMIEAALSIHRIESRNNFIDFALRGGLRF